MIALPDRLASYCDVARRMMINSNMSRNSCIAATHISYRCLSLLGFSVEPVAVKFLVELPALALAFGSGLDQVELSRASKLVQLGDGKNWNGHLICIVDRCWLLDSAFDQADEALGWKLRLPTVCQVFPLPEKLSSLDFHGTWEMQSDTTGMLAKIQYITTGDQTWRSSLAWNDEGLAILEEMILRRVR